MARPTEAKLRKAQTDLEKLASKLRTMNADLLNMTANPKGSDMEMCKQIREAAKGLSEAASTAVKARESLEAPARILAGRKALR